MSALAERLAALSPERRLLLEMMQKQQGQQSVPVRTRRRPFVLLSEEDRRLLPDDVEDAYPLSGMQLGMIYHMKLTLGDPVPAYHNVFVFEMKSRFDAGALEAAIRRVVAVHPILRTSFDLTTYSEPMQLVHRTACMPVHVADLRGLSPACQQEVLAAFVTAENRRVLDLTRAPLMRFHIHRCGDDEFLLTIAEMHAIAEGWSTFQTLDEIFRNYLALLRGEPLPEPQPLSVSYGDFVHLERQAMQSEESRSFWAEKLRDATVLKPPRWPRAYRQAQRSLRRKRTDEIPPELLDKLARLSQSMGVPLKSVLFAAHLKVMSLISGQAELVTGLEVHGRPEEEDGERVCGIFVNTLPFRFELGTKTWLQMIQDTFAGELEMMPHRRYPLAALQSGWGPEALIEVAFAYLNFHHFGQLAPGAKGIACRVIPDQSVTHFPLQVSFALSGGSSKRLVVTVVNDDTEIAEAQIHELRGYYQAVLSALAGDPASTHDSRCFLSEVERHRLLREWNDTRVEYPRDRRLQDLFDEQARRSPHAAAVVAGGRRWTYGEIAGLADRLASHLQELGVGPQERVGICLERSPEMVVGLLGILKAGGAFVPLDPSHPRERLELVMRDAGMTTVVTREALAGGLSGAGRTMVCLDAHREALASEPGGSDVTSAAIAEGLAYVLYTSGSTGIPKGVMVTHRSLVNYLVWCIEAYGVEAGRSVPVHSSIGFDLTLTSLFAPLLAGGSLDLVAESRAGEALEAALATGNAPGLLKLTPSHLEMLQRRLSSRPAAQRAGVLVIGGENLLGESLAFWRTHSRGTRLVNEYGPTEATVGCCAHEVPPGAELAGSVPIGRPIANARIHLLDPWLRPVSVGTPGRLYVAGDGLALGYLNRADLTAASFLPDPYGEEPGGRLYDTGDLARYLPDGNLEYLGRRDDQVKVRGFRIELGEIEAALRQHPAVGEAAVAARREETVRLVAYVVPAAGEEPAISELRSFLAGKLPEYMVPEAFMLLAELPLTVNGKVDRKALPAPSRVRPVLAEAFVAPRSGLERALAEIWLEVLPVDTVGVHDNFFDLGGNSLLFVRAHQKIQDLLGHEFPMTELFRFPTVSTLARHLSQGRSDNPDLGTDRVAARRALGRTHAVARDRRQAARQHLEMQHDEV